MFDMLCAVCAVQKGAPMILLVIGGSFGLAQLMQTRQELRDANSSMKVRYPLVTTAAIVTRIRTALKASGRQNTTLEEEHEVIRTTPATAPANDSQSPYPASECAGTRGAGIGIGDGGKQKGPKMTDVGRWGNCWHLAVTWGAFLISR